eukprot:SAG11_NODE_36781_length_260_cov_0.484472_1_plen_27_part_10
MFTGLSVVLTLSGVFAFLLLLLIYIPR